MKKLLLTFIAFFLLAGTVHAAYPDYTGFVNDKTNTLSSEQVKNLESKLVEYDKQTTNQIAVLLVDTTSPETIEEYGIHIFDLWKPGVKGRDNGILMTFAMSDRKMRIDVGRGLEGSLTDIQAKHIIDNTITPEFKNKNYYDGINKGIDQVMIAVSPESPIASVAAQSAKDNAAGGIVLFIIIILVIVIIFIALSPYTPLGGEGSWGYSGVWVSSGGFGSDSDSDSGSGFGGFGGGVSSGGGASGSW